MSTITLIDKGLEIKINQLEKQIGHTGYHKITNIPIKDGVEIFAKKEWEQLSGSVKIRAAFAIIKDAIYSGQLSIEKTILDATSGNTGIAYAYIAQYLGIKLSLVIPENATKERIDLLKSLGAKLHFTSKFEGTDGAQYEALNLYAKDPNKYVYVDQYKNANNWKAHYHGTAKEILRDIPNITHFVSGIGTSGTFSGISRRLKEDKPKTRIISLQPDSALHGIEGWKHLETSIIPANYDPYLADTQLEIETNEAYRTMKLIYKHENLKISPSSAANLTGALELANRINQGTIVTILPDDATRYGEIFEKIIKN